MPLYEYKCSGMDCSHNFETLAKHDETIRCPKCDRELSPEQRTVSASRGYVIGSTTPVKQ